MAHDAFRDQLPAYLAGSLDLAQEVDLEAHLRDCPACARELQALRTGRPTTPSSTTRARSARPSNRPPVSRMIPAFAAAGAVGIVVALLTTGKSSTDRDLELPSPVVYRDATPASAVSIETSESSRPVVAVSTGLGASDAERIARTGDTASSSASRSHEPFPTLPLADVPMNRRHEPVGALPNGARVGRQPITPSVLPVMDGTTPATSIDPASWNRLPIMPPLASRHPSSEPPPGRPTDASPVAAAQSAASAPATRVRLAWVVANPEVAVQRLGDWVAVTREATMAIQGERLIVRLPAPEFPTLLGELSREGRYRAIPHDAIEEPMGGGERSSDRDDMMTVELVLETG